ncbi:hypothetical protein ACFX1X_026922 [Malus domestica]
MAVEAILGYLESKNEISNSGQFTAQRGLHGFRYIVAQDIKREMWMFTDEGRAYTATGLPEVQLFLAIPPKGIPKEELQKKLDPSVFKIGSAQAVKRKWVEIPSN